MNNRSITGLLMASAMAASLMTLPVVASAQVSVSPGGVTVQRGSSQPGAGSSNITVNRGGVTVDRQANGATGRSAPKSNRTGKSAAAGASVVIVDNNRTVAVDCATDPSVIVNGNRATLTLTGTCSNVMLNGNNGRVSGSVNTIQINGNNNEATLDVVDSISVPGNNNKITYKASSNPRKATRVSSPGQRNSVSRAQ